MKRLLNWFKQVLLMLGLVFACQSNATAATSWPTDIVFGEIENAQPGAILASVDVNQSISGLGIAINGQYYALLGFDRTLQNYDDPKKGIFKLTDASGNEIGLGIAFVGTITVTQKEWITNRELMSSFNKDSIYTAMTDDVVNRAASASFPPLTGVLLDRSTTGSTTISVNGQVVLVKLTSDEVNFSSISLPNIQITVCAKSTDWNYKYSDVLVNGQTSTITNPRTCKISLPTASNISFGTFKANHPSGLVGNIQETQIGVTCNRKSTDKTPVYLQIIPTDSVTRDARAIGLTNERDNQLSDSLVVKAKLDQNDTTACSTVGGGWVELKKKLEIDSIAANLEQYSNSYSIYWSLCKLKEESLPIGTYKGSATLSITFN